jgi:p21-activated kinase 1
MAKSSSGQGTAKHLHQGPVAAQPLARAPTSKKDAAQQGQPRRRDKAKENEDVVRQLQSICTPGDPNLVYRSLQKIGQG